MSTIQIYHDNSGIPVEMNAEEFQKFIPAPINGKVAPSAVTKARDYLKKKKYKEAVEKFRGWLRKYPQDKAAWLDLGASLYYLTYLEPALDATKKALALDNNYALALNNVGLYHQMRNDSQKSIEWYSKAGNAGYTDAYFNLALAMLRVLMDEYPNHTEKDWDAAWEMYGWRFKKSNPVPIANVPDELKLWNGETDGGVLALTEQGIGDTIMFSRYVSKLPAGSIYAIPEDLNALFAGWEYCNDTTDYRGCKYWIPAAAVPMYVKEIPPVVWKDKASGDKIGVCWQGNKDHANDHNRSYPELRKEMLALADFNLQFGDNKELKTWDDTLALLRQCKTVITIDSSLAHLAASMGIRTMVLMPKFDWDFRWGTGKTNPWYPTVEAYSTWEELKKNL